MKIQIENSHKVIAGITFLVVLLFVTAFKAIENIERVQNTSNSNTRANPFYIDIRILVMNDKVEALRKFVTGWQEIQE
jgi:hypothetical protein